MGRCYLTQVSFKDFGIVAGCLLCCCCCFDIAGALNARYLVAIVIRRSEVRWKVARGEKINNYGNN